MQVVDNFFQVFLCFVLAGHVGELDAVRRFHIHLGVALAHAEHHGAGAAAHLVHHLLGQPVAQESE